jgi:hypothetical protein
LTIGSCCRKGIILSSPGASQTAPARGLAQSAPHVAGILTTTVRGCRTYISTPRVTAIHFRATRTSRILTSERRSLGDSLDNGNAPVVIRRNSSVPRYWPAQYPGAMTGPRAIPIVFGDIAFVDGRQCGVRSEEAVTTGCS